MINISVMISALGVLVLDTNLFTIKTLCIVKGHMISKIEENVKHCFQIIVVYEDLFIANHVFTYLRTNVIQLNEFCVLYIG